MELLGAGARRAPLEEHRAVRAARHVGERVAAHLARRLGQVARLPVDRAGRVLEQQPRAAAREPAAEVGGHRQVDVVVGVLGDQVVVVGDDVDLVGPAPVVDVRARGGHEVGGHRDVGRQLAQDVALEPVALEVLGRREAPEVELLGRVDGHRRAPRGGDLLPRAVALAPEGRAPGVVERVDRPVALAQPAAERLRAGLAVARADVRAVLVVDVPQRQRRMVAVALGQRAAIRTAARR